MVDDHLQLAEVAGYKNKICGLIEVTAHPTVSIFDPRLIFATFVYLIL